MTRPTADWDQIGRYLAGELQGMNLREGDSVKAGQPLVRLDSSQAEQEG